MKAFLAFLFRRILTILVTLFISTAVLYAAFMLTPAETRATLFLPRNTSHMTEEQLENYVNQVIQRNHLNDPFPVQYFYWVKNMLQGNWGYSPILGEEVFSAIVERSPVTAELSLYSILAFLPLGLISGVIAGSRQNKPVDHLFRFKAYVATSLPPFILALVLMAIFYVDLYWFAPERTSNAMSLIINSSQFHQYTGLLTLDGLLNGRMDVTFDALRHLAMPVFTLAIAHWATLGRITRASMIQETHLDYVTAARASGLRERTIVWRQMLPNAIAPALTSSMLSAASLITGVFVVEIIFGFHGISDVAVKSMSNIPDAAAALGFSIYSVIVVLILMLILDLVQSAVDPRIRSGADQ